MEQKIFRGMRCELVAFLSYSMSSVIFFVQGMSHLLRCNNFNVVSAVIDVLTELVSPGFSPVCFVLCDQARPEVRQRAIIL